MSLDTGPHPPRRNESSAPARRSVTLRHCATRSFLPFPAVSPLRARCPRPRDRRYAIRARSALSLSPSFSRSYQLNAKLTVDLVRPDVAARARARSFARRAYGRRVHHDATQNCTSAKRRPLTSIASCAHDDACFPPVQHAIQPPPLLYLRGYYTLSGVARPLSCPTTRRGGQRSVYVLL